jgi:WD40-like Beta Propeller Repeat
MNTPHRTQIWLVLVAIAALQLACGQSAAVSAPEVISASYDGFRNPQRVKIPGYDDDAMEPFLSRDGQILFFNNSNAPGVNTNLHYAYRVDDMTFEYMGEVENVNSDVLDAVPSMDAAGNLYLVSLREYDDSLITIFRGQFVDGQVSAVSAVAGLSEERLFRVNFDVEVSADGETLYFVDGRFRKNEHIPREANLVMAVKQGNGFVRVENSDEIFQHINTDALEYAAAISADELEFFFTRLDQDLSSPPEIFRAVRSSTDEPFRQPEKVSAITGFVEAATLSPDGSSLYYHMKEDDRFVIYRVVR